MIISHTDKKQTSQHRSRLEPMQIHNMSTRNNQNMHRRGFNKIKSEITYT